MSKIFLTLLSSPSYLEGVIVLYRSLIKYGQTKYPFACVCSKSLEDKDVCLLEKQGVQCIRLSQTAIDGVDLSFQPNSYDRWSYTFDKLLIWDLTEYDKVVFLDSDMIVMDNIDELFNKPAFSAVAAGQLLFGWDWLNSGLMVIEPDKKVCSKLLSQISTTVTNFSKETNPVGDQDVINDYILNWRSRDDLHLHEGYNMVFRGMTEYHRKFGFNYGKNIKVVHFIGPWYDKPWNHSLWKVFYHLVGYFLHNRYILKAYIAYQRILWRYRIGNSLRNVFK